MTVNILQKLRTHTPTLVGINRCKKFAVCIPLLETPQGYDLLFEVRSGTVGRQPGDICFPGGMMEPGETAEQTAVRECCEELLICREQIELLGMMDVLVEDGGMVIDTFAVLLREYHNTFSEDEVSGIFTVPLEALLQMRPELYYTTEYTVPDDNFPFDRIVGGKQYPWRKKREEMFFYTWNDRTIWGITAKILEAFLEVCREER